MQQDAEELKSFLQIYPNIKDCTLQYFMDWGREWTAWKEKMPKIKEWGWKRIAELNKKWYWIFFSVNSMLEWKRDQKSVMYINAWVMENDEDDKEVQKENLRKSPLSPSLVIESKKSLHAYWFAKDWTIENWNKICWWLRNYFNGDKQIIDISRVLRIPWFSHCKDLDNPFLCRMIDYNDVYYTESEMLNAFRDTMSDSEKQEQIYKFNSMILRWWTHNSSKSDDFWTNASSLDNEMMLTKLSWTEYVWYEDITFKTKSNWTKQIVCNWKSTWCRLDREWMIWSKDKWWPTWIQRVIWYCGRAIDWKWLYQLLKSEFPELIEQRQKTKTPNKNNLWNKQSEEMLDENNDKEDTKNEEEITYTTDENDKIVVDLDSKTPITRWVQWIDDYFGMIEYGSLVVFTWRAWSGKTEYCFFMARQNADRWEKTVFLSLEMTRQKLLERTARKRLWITVKEWNQKSFDNNRKEKFNDELNKLADYNNLSMFTTNNRSIEWIIKLIQDQYLKWVKLFFIDNLWFITWKEWETEFEVQARAVRELKWLTNTLWITIVLLHHQKKWDWRTIDNYSLTRGSGKINDDADWCMTIKREGQYSSIECYKNRDNWECWLIALEFVKWNFILMDWDEETELEQKKEKPF